MSLAPLFTGDCVQGLCVMLQEHVGIMERERETTI